MDESLSSFTTTLSSRFPSFAYGNDGQELGRSDTEGRPSDGMDESENQERNKAMNEMEIDISTSDTDDSDGPVVVPSNEVEASIARSSQRTRRNAPFIPTEYSEQEREAYQLLFATQMEHEDILMVCARILDEANDVSLVREAAAYLEEIEAKRT